MCCEKEKDLEKNMHQWKVFEKDIKEAFIRSSGPGGQNINKVSTCVVLKHVPTGIRVKCQEERTQQANRRKARWLLLEKIEKKKRQEVLTLRQQKEKERRSKRERPKALKERILKEKRYRSEKKNIRKKIGTMDPDQL